MNKIKQLLYWISTDGLLHMLVSMVMLLSCFYIFGYVYSIILTLMICIIKEFYDYFINKSNTIKQISHDIICDLLGVLMATFILIIHYIINII